MQSQVSFHAAPGMPGVLPSSTPLSKLELHFSCKKLKNMDVLSKSDPQVQVYMKMRQEAYQLVAKTEMIKDNLNPSFTKAVPVDYYFEEVQHLKLVVMDIDKPKGGVENQDFIGQVEVTLADVVASPGQSLTKPLMNPKYRKSTGFITVTAQEVSSSKMTARFHVVANHLDKKDLFGKSDPFLRISRYQKDGSWTVVHKTEVLKKTLDPRWKPFELPLSTLNSCDPERPLLFQCYDWNSSGKEDFIGEFRATASELEHSVSKEYKLINPKKKKKRHYHDSGVVKFLKFEIEEEPSFLDYIRGGCEIGLVVGIDFTASNGNPNYAGSLHYRNPYEPNEYAKAIMAICDILACYDSDQKFPCFGFGAKIPPNNQVSHCFPLNGNYGDPEVVGVQGILDAYYAALNNVTLYGPTNFAPIISRAAEVASAQASSREQQYLILLMITDGVISDMPDTVEEIVRASDLPLSIVIVGVGTADFTNMDVLDADDKPLRNRAGKTMSRDIVQFVPFRNYKDVHYSRLAADTLQEIPGQLLGYMKSKGLKPNPPRAAVAASMSSMTSQSFVGSATGRPPSSGPYAGPPGASSTTSAHTAGGFQSRPYDPPLTAPHGAGMSAGHRQQHMPPSQRVQQWQGAPSQDTSQSFMTPQQWRQQPPPDVVSAQSQQWNGDRAQFAGMPSQYLGGTMQQWPNSPPQWTGGPPSSHSGEEGQWSKTSQKFGGSSQQWHPHSTAQWHPHSTQQTSQQQHSRQWDSAASQQQMYSEEWDYNMPPENPFSRPSPPSSYSDSSSVPQDRRDEAYAARPGPPSDGGDTAPSGQSPEDSSRRFWSEGF